MGSYGRQCRNCEHYRLEDWSPWSYECKQGHNTPNAGYTDACSDYEEQSTIGRSTNSCDDCEHCDRWSLGGPTCSKGYDIPESRHACEKFEEKANGEHETSHNGEYYESGSSGSEDSYYSSGDYSESSSCTSSFGIGTFLFVIVCIGIGIGIISSFMKTSNNSNYQKPSINYQQYQESYDNNLLVREKSKRNEAFIEAVMKGDTETVKSLLEKGVDMNTKDYNDRTALMIAASVLSVK